jgi:hypothetical protein
LATVPRVELQQRIADRIGEFLIFAVTPPRQATGAEQTRQIAEVTLARLRSVGIDGLILYDIDDSADNRPDYVAGTGLSTRPATGNIAAGHITQPST